MGKVFVTDEVNDGYCAKVHKSKKLWIEDGAATHYMVPSAAATAGKTVCSTAAFLKSVIVGTKPAAAASLRIYDTSAGGNSCADGAGISALSSAFDVSGSQCILDMVLEASAALSADQIYYPRVIPLNVYCASGIAVEVGDAGIRNAGRIGGIQGLTIVYQA